MVRVFTNGPGQVIPKTQKMVLDATLLNTQHYKVRIKGTSRVYRKGSLWDSLDYDYIYIYIYIYDNFIN